MTLAQPAQIGSVLDKTKQSSVSIALSCDEIIIDATNVLDDGIQQASERSRSRT